ncbi:Aldo/keto reductase [Massarina eburnea CBS 473.64]|uniref:Aldo/keto reductase n=1 Tax=Massarina eburnea CBS 473.64 TaxID=1395130 RepID=A0A6A6RYG6_9PLEO|nr:Aldo/keto reductase [Massarina eburnea CBS 473.64]
MVKLLNKEVGNPGYGLMGLTWRANPQPAENSFEAMKTALAKGAYFWNGGELYGTPERNSLHLLNEYFTKYPEDADKVVLSIKGGLVPGTLNPDNSEANVSRSIEECLKVLDGKKSLDIFECARLEPNTPIESMIGTIAKYVKAGKVGGIGLSEVGAESIRRAHKVHPIAAVEVEFSLYCTDILTNGVAQTCAELDIPIIAYSPLGRGFLTGQWKTLDDIPKDSHIRYFPRFQPDVFDENIKLAEEVQKIAAAKGVTPAQIALGWVVAHSGKDGLAQILAIPGSTTSARVEENSKPAVLNEEDLATIGEVLKKIEIKGARYPGGAGGEE